MGSILHTENEVESAIQRFEKARLLGAGPIEKVFRPSLVVKGEAAAASSLPLPRTVAKHQNGLSKAEIERLSAAGHFMRRFGTQIHITTEDHEAKEGDARALFSQVKNHLVRIQRDIGQRLNMPVPAYYVEVLEAKHAVHQHLIGVVPVGRFARETIERLKSSRLFGDHLDACRVKNMERLVRYLSKEATTQAHYAFNRSFRRNNGRHVLGIGGGDRVRLSDALKEDMIREGLIEPYRKTYASRALPRTPKPVATPIREPDPHGLFGPLPEVVAPPRPRGLPPRRPKLIVPSQQNLALERLPNVIDLMARLGSTHAEIAEKVGLSRGQTTNILNGQFGASRTVARRVLELAFAA